jgi:hypothetical protein
MHSMQKTARLTGLLYLIIIICAGFSQGFVRSNLIVPQNAAETVSNILASEGLFRLGFVTDLIAFMTDAVVAILLYVLLRPVSKTISLLAASLRLLAHPAIAAINLLNHLAAVLLLSGAEYLAVLEGDQLNALVMFFLEAHRNGYLIAGAFFGLHCFFLGYLLFKAGYFPKILGVFLVVASLGYLIESFGTFLLPKYRAVWTWIVAVPAVIAELSLCLWLLIRGINVKKWDEQGERR